MNQYTAVRGATEATPADPARDTTRARSRSRERVSYIEYFRAVAIFIIVAGHTYALAWTHAVSEDPQTRITWLNMVPAIITGGTAYFVFISGFLYRQVFYRRTSYGEFMRKKALYVGLPYVVLATPLILAEILFGAFSVVTYKDGVPYGGSVFVDFVVLFTTGRMVTAYWYIPFIFVVFAASPLFDRFIALNHAARLAVFGAAVALAFWVVRPADNLNPLHSFLYFSQFYLFGILFCEGRDWIMSILCRRSVLFGLALALLAAAAFQAVDLGIPGNLERTAAGGLGFPGWDMEIAQKYIGILLACGALSRWGHVLAKPFRFVADHSFGIFFTHGVVLAFLVRVPEAFSPHVGEPLLDLAIWSSIVFALSLAIVVAVRTLTGTYSRYIIGC